MNEEETIDDDFELAEDEEGLSADFKKKVRKIQGALKQCREERKNFLDGWQRAKADYINHKNEEAKRTEEMAKFISAGLIRELFPVLDSFDLAVAHGPGSETEKGVLLIRQQFQDILKKMGLEIIKVQAGDAFNPEIHESVGEAESDEEAGTVAEEVQKGYRLFGRVLRPSRVRLSKEKK